VEIIKGKIYKHYNYKSLFTFAPLSISEGEIYLLIGRNGVGKSTLLRLLAKVEDYSWNDNLITNKFHINIELKKFKLSSNSMDCFRIDKQSKKLYKISVLKKTISDYKITKYPETPFHIIDKYDISYMPSELVYYKNMKINNLLDFYKSTHKNFDYYYAIKHLELFKLPLTKNITKISNGEKKVLAFIICLSFNCSLYLIDEPFPNIDLLNDEYFREMIIKKHNKKRTFIIATNQIHEFEKVSSKFLFINNRNEIEVSDTNEIRSQTSLSIEDYFKEQIKC